MTRCRVAELRQTLLLSCRTVKRRLDRSLRPQAVILERFAKLGVQLDFYRVREARIRLTSGFKPFSSQRSSSAIWAGVSRLLASAFSFFAAPSTASLYVSTRSSHCWTFGPDSFSTLTVPVGQSAPACIVLQNTSGAAACCAFTVASDSAMTPAATARRNVVVIGTPSFSALYRSRLVFNQRAPREAQ